MTDKHLLYWIFKVDRHFARCTKLDDLKESDFQRINAPAWVWPAFNEARKGSVIQ